PPFDPRPGRPHDPASRAPHGHGHVHLRPHRRARLRPQDRRGCSGRDPQRPAGDRGLPGGAGMSLLEMEGVSGGYGQVQVLHGIDLAVDLGHVAVVLGANGAGKTTTLRAISGMISVTGDIRPDGRSIVGKPPEAVSKLGIAHVPQGRGTFTELTVDENMRIGAINRKDNEVAGDLERWYAAFPRLGERRKQEAGSMSGGEQQMLALARAMMARPRLLLRDEPSLGL